MRKNLLDLVRSFAFIIISLCSLSTPVLSQKEVSSKTVNLTTTQVPRNIKQLAATLTPSNIQWWSSSDSMLQLVLMGPFEGNWFKAKDCLLMDSWPGVQKKPKHTDAIDLMRALVAWRAKVCGAVQKQVELEIASLIAADINANEIPNDPLADSLIKAVLLKEVAVANVEILDREGRPTGKMGPHVNFETPKGNDKPSSDVDISTSGINTELAVAMFNKKFKERVGVVVESSTLFDYNVYAKDWIHNLKFDKTRNEAGKEITTKVTPGVEHTAVAVEALALRNRLLEKSSLLHIRRFCTALEWDNYVKSRLKNVATGELLGVKQLLNEVNEQHEFFEQLIQQKTITIRRPLDSVAGLYQSAWSAPKAANYFQDALRTSASNRLYEDKLREVKGFRVKYALAEEGRPQHLSLQDSLVHFAAQLTRSLSEALYFANEVYASEGAVLHTVVGIQIGDKTAASQGGVKPEIVLSREQYQQSFNENVGDVMKDLTTYAEYPPLAYFIAGKYLNRMLKAAEALNPNATKHPLYAKFKSIADKSVAAKASPEIGDDLLACAAVFKKANKQSMAVLRKEVMSFAAEIIKM